MQRRPDSLWQGLLPTFGDVLQRNLLRPVFPGIRELLRQHALQQIVPKVLYGPLLLEGRYLLRLSLLFARPRLLQRPVLRSGCGLLRKHLLPGRVCLLP